MDPRLEELAKLSGVPINELEGIAPEYLESILSIPPKELAEGWEDFTPDGMFSTYKEELEWAAEGWQLLRPAVAA
jgi:hypothetical protein